MNKGKVRFSKLPTFQSKLSVQYFHQLIPEVTTKTRRQKKNQQIEEYVQIYEIFLKLLYGQEINDREEKMIMFKNSNVKIEDNTNFSLDLPEAIVSLPNPDQMPDEYNCPLKQLEIFDQIIKSLNIDERNIHDKLFVKAFENVFTHLADKKIYSLFELKSRGMESNQHQNRNTLTLIGTAQQLFQKSPDRSPRSLILTDNPNLVNPTELQLFQKDDSVKLFVRRFRKYLREKVDFNLSSQTSITDHLQIDLQKLLYSQKKAYSQGEFLKQQGSQWYKTRNETADILTLIRNAIIIKMSLKGFQIKQFLSRDAKVIYLCLYMSEKMLETAAENFKLQKKLSFCYTDILSLEPVDKQYRPLRLNGRLWRPEEYDNSPYLEYLRPLIVNLIKEINFKKLAREVGQSGLNIELFEYGKSDLYGDIEGPSDDEWTAYYKYLVHLNKHVKVCRENSKISSDLALCIDEQLTVEELYRIRKKIPHHISIYEQEMNAFEVSLLNESIQKLIEETKFITAQIPVIKKLKLFKQSQLAHSYFYAFKESLKVANCQQIYLKTLWDRYEQKPFELYVPFQSDLRNQSIKNMIKQQLKWSRYIKNEENQTSLFSANERLKLAYQVISETVNLDKLINLQFINQYFCPHDQYELFGYCRNISKAISDDKLNYKKKPFDIFSEWHLDLIHPWAMPTKKISNYFGEKIGLFFEFSTFFIKSETLLAAFGCIFSIILYSAQSSDKNIQSASIGIYSELIIFTNSYITAFWNQKRLIFNLRTGQDKNVEENLIRSNFKGYYIRSIENDQLNSTGVNFTKFVQRLTVSIFVLLFLIGSNIGIMVGLYFFSYYLKLVFEEKQIGFANFEIIILATINYVIQSILDGFYQQIAILLSDFENFQTISDYEASYILKKFCLQSVAKLGPMLIMYFLSVPFQLYCHYDYCQTQVQFFVGTTTLLFFFTKASQLIVLQYNTKVKFPFKILIRDHQSLWDYIENQDQKEQFIMESDMNKIIDEQMDFFIFSTLTNIFGSLFPFSQTLLWIWTIVQIQILKFKLIFIYHRSWPKGQSSLGIWEELIILLSFTSLLCNTGITCIQYYENINNQVILMFLVLLLFNIFIQFLIHSVFGTTPLILEQLIRRGKYLYKTNIQIKSNLNRGSSKENKDNLQKCPLFKVFGSNSFLSNDYFETISSDDEISDYYQHNCKKISVRLAIEEEQKIYKMKELNLDLESLATSPQTYNQPILKKTQTESITEINKSFLQHSRQIERQETNFRKKLEQRIEDYKKKINLVSKLDYNFLSNYYSNRAIHWAFKIQTPLKKGKQLIKDKTNIWKFFFRLNLLSDYNLYWGDFRLNLSQSFIPRRRKMFQNLDLKRYHILKKAYDRTQENFQNIAHTKFRRKFSQFGNTLTAEEVKEYNNLVYKYQNFIEKRTWLNCRKVQIFKVKALFFKGFRKQTIRKQSYQYALEYYEATKRLNEIEYESDIHKKFTTLVQYSSMNFYTLDLFVDLFNKLEYEQKTTYVFPYANGRINQKVYHSQSLKSEIYKNVIDKSKDTYIFEQQNQKVEEFGFQYFLDEINQIPNIKMKKHIHDILWIVEIDNKNYLMQFFQIRHGQQLQFQQYYNDNLGIYIGQSQNYIKLLNIIDQIDDFFIKGYCISLYQINEECKSMYQVLQFRKKYLLNYTIEELKQFLYANLILLSKQNINNISIYNYILINNEYMILNSIKQSDNIIHQLIQVIIEMILLQPVEDYIKALQNLQHPLRYLLQDIFKSDKKPVELLDLIIDQKSFQEINFKQAPQQKEISYQQHIEFMKHQMNFHLRLKQFRKCLYIVKETEEFVRINNFHASQELLPFFINYFSKNLTAYILKSNEIKKILDILLLYYFKICCIFALRRDFSSDINLLIDALKKCSAQIRVLFRQLNLNVKLENLSEVEQCIILKRKLREIPQHQSSISSFERLNLINTLRKNQDYISIILQYQTQLQRYLNQFRAINAIENYFNKNFVLASIQYSEIISNQEQLVLREPAPNVMNIPIDHSPGLINFQQSSPTDDEQLVTANTETNTNTLVQGDSLYCLQLIFFKFLNLINMYDSKNEQFDYYFTNFLELEGVNDDVFNFYLIQLKILKKMRPEQKELDSDLECEVGKFIYIKNQKQIEICFNEFNDIICKEEQQFYKTQILTYSNINQKIENRTFIKHIIDSQVNQNQNFFDYLFQIKAIQQLLHLDQFQPVSHSLQKQIKIKQTTKNAQNSYINLLQKYHSSINFNEDSWFFHDSLQETQMFYYLSVCFSYSPKHFENLNKLSLGNNEQVEYAVRQIKKFQSQPKFYCQILKCTQINNKFAQKFLFDQSLSQFQQYQIFCQYLNCSLKQHSNLKISYQLIKQNCVEKLEASILVLGIIQAFIEFQQFDMVDLVLQFSQRLLQSQAQIYHQIHEGFEKDLQFIECVYQDKKENIPYPALYLYEYTKDFKVFENNIFNYQYQLFNMLMNQDYNLIYEIISENLNQMQQQKLLPEAYYRFRDLFISYQEVVMAMLGLIEPKPIYIAKLNDYKEGTLMYAILSHFKCKFYLNMIDYESALKYSEQTLKFISTNLKNQNIVVSISKDSLSQEFPIHQTLKLLQIEDYDILIEESQDSDYIHLFNQDFINDAILNYLRIKINLYDIPPNINLLFSLQLILDNQFHITYLQLIYAEYFNYFMNDEEKKLEEQLVIDSQLKITEIKQQIKKEEQKQKAFYSLKLNVFNDFTHIDYRLKILDFQLNLYVSSTNFISKKLINNLINQCAQRAIDGFLKCLPNNQKIVLPYVSIMYLIQCESYQFLNQIQKAQNMIDLAETSLKGWFDDYKHPLKGVFFFYQGNHLRWLYQQYLQCIKEIIALKLFDAVEIKVISQGLINQDSLVIKTFDYYHQNIIKQVTSHLQNFIFQQIGKHEKQNIFYKYLEEDAQDILDDVLFMSSIKELNGVTQFLDALAIFNHFETEHRCIDIIKQLVTQ